jgi:CRISPR-associated protein Csm5
MKLGHLEKKKAVVKALAPVFIGSGENIGKKEYLYYPDKRKVYIPNLFKMYSLLEKRNLASRYENYILYENKADLLKFLRQCGITDEQTAYFTEYSIDVGDTIIKDDKHKRREIHFFTRDSSHLPYVLGSSLKGALRTAILSYRLISHARRKSFADTVISALNDEIAGKKGAVDREAKKIEENIFNILEMHKEKPWDAVNDFMKALSISDSSPLGHESMVLCEKIDVTVSGNEKTVPIYRECLKPGTELSFDITLDTRIAKAAGFGWHELEEALKSFNEMYEKYFAVYFIKPRAYDIAPCEKGWPIYIGGGVGFVSKTAVYPLMEHGSGLEYTSTLLDSKFPKNHMHRNDIKTGVSPHIIKCARYNGRLYPMGRCEFILSG